MLDIISIINLLPSWKEFRNSLEFFCIDFNTKPVLSQVLYIALALIIAPIAIVIGLSLLLLQGACFLLGSPSFLIYGYSMDFTELANRVLKDDFHSNNILRLLGAFIFSPFWLVRLFGLLIREAAFQQQKNLKARLAEKFVTSLGRHSGSKIWSICRPLAQSMPQSEFGYYLENEDAFYLAIAFFQRAFGNIDAFSKELREVVSRCKCWDDMKIKMRAAGDIYSILSNGNGNGVFTFSRVNTLTAVHLKRLFDSFSSVDLDVRLDDENENENEYRPIWIAFRCNIISFLYVWSSNLRNGDERLFQWLDFYGCTSLLESIACFCRNSHQDTTIREGIKFLSNLIPLILKAHNKTIDDQLARAIGIKRIASPLNDLPPLPSFYRPDDFLTLVDSIKQGHLIKI